MPIFGKSSLLKGDFLKNKLMTKKLLASFFLILAVTLRETIGIPGLGLTDSQEITAYILLIAALFWVSEIIPLFVVSFLILALEIVWLFPALKSEGLPLTPSVFYGSFFSNIILLFLGGFVLSSLMQKYGMDIKFAQLILQKTKGHPATTLLGIIVACAFLSMWISNTATTAMMLTIVFPLIKHMPENHKFRVALVLSIPFACNIGGIGTPIGTPPNAIALSYLTQKGLDLSFIQWMAMTVPFLIIFLILLWRILLYAYPPKDLHLEITTRATTRFTEKHWATIVIFVLTALGWFFGKDLSLSTGTVALLPIIASFWFGLLDTSDFRKLPWDILYIISGGLALGVALNLSGLDRELVSILPQNTSLFLLLTVSVLIAGVMSTVMSNTATAGLIIPLIMTLQLSNNSILTLAISLALMCSLAMALPVTTPPNAIAFSSRAIKTKDMMYIGSIMTLAGMAIIILVAPWYWSWINTFVKIG